MRPSIVNRRPRNSYLHDLIQRQRIHRLGRQQLLRRLCAAQDLEQHRCLGRNVSHAVLQVLARVDIKVQNEVDVHVCASGVWVSRYRDRIERDEVLLPERSRGGNLTFIRNGRGFAVQGAFVPEYSRVRTAFVVPGEHAAGEGEGADVVVVWGLVGVEDGGVALAGEDVEAVDGEGARGGAFDFDDVEGVPVDAEDHVCVAGHLDDSV